MLASKSLACWSGQIFQLYPDFLFFCTVMLQGCGNFVHQHQWHMGVDKVVGILPMAWCWGQAAASCSCRGPEYLHSLLNCLPLHIEGTCKWGFDLKPYVLVCTCQLRQLEYLWFSVVSFHAWPIPVCFWPDQSFLKDWYCLLPLSAMSQILTWWGDGCPLQALLMLTGYFITWEKTGKRAWTSPWMERTLVLGEKQISNGFYTYERFLELITR